MPMTTTATFRYEGPPACVDCQRAGVPVCAHIGFNPEAWEGMIGRQVHAPGLDPRCDGPDAQYAHTLTTYQISDDRKTLTATIQTDRPQFHDLARHLSLRTLLPAKAAVRAIHHETGEKLEEGCYDRFLRPGEQVAIDRDLYHVASVEHPHRDPVSGTAPDVDLQVARLVPVPTETVQPVQPMGDNHGTA